jgi:tetratricopeptide (TPR) repeat protein
MKRMVAMTVAAVLCSGAFAADKDAAAAVQAAKSVAWSLDDDRTEMVVAISPARQTLQIAGSAGTLLGASISAIQNEKYRKAIEEVLQDYDGNAIFRERLESRLTQALGNRAHRINPMGSTAGSNDVRTLQDERLERLAAEGNDLVLDLEAEYGLFGYKGLLVAKLDAKLYDAKNQRHVWIDSLLASPEVILASDKLKDPTANLMPNLSDPRFGADENAVAQWTGDGGKLFRERFEAAVDGCISALLTELGLVQEAPGAYYLGRVYLMRKQFEAAESYFNMALSIDPNNADAKNGLSVAQAHDGKVDDALATAQQLMSSHPEYGPAHYNTAWWLATEKNDAAAAKPHYEKAKQLGMPENKKLEKSL